MRGIGHPIGNLCNLNLMMATRVSGVGLSKNTNHVYGLTLTLIPRNSGEQSLESNKPTFNVIGATHYTGVYVGDDPNTMLWSYFRSEIKP